MNVSELYDFLRSQYAARADLAWYERGSPAFASDLDFKFWRIVRAPGDVAVCSVADFWTIDLNDPAAVIAAADRPLGAGEYFVTLTPQGAGATGLTAENSGSIKVLLSELARNRAALFQDAGIARITGRTVPRDQLAKESIQAAKQAAQTARDNQRAAKQGAEVGSFGVPDLTVPVGNLAASIVSAVARGLGLGAAAFLGQLPPVVIVIGAVGVIGLGAYAVKKAVD